MKRFSKSEVLNENVVALLEEERVREAIALTKSEASTTELHWEIAVAAARVDRTGMLLRWILDERVRVDCRRTAGRTLLHDTAAYSNVEGTRAVLECGPDINARDDRGRTPLLETVYGEEPLEAPAIAELLLGAGAIVDLKSAVRWSVVSSVQSDSTIESATGRLADELAQLSTTAISFEASRYGDGSWEVNLRRMADDDAPPVEVARILANRNPRIARVNRRIYAGLGLGD